MLYSTVEHELLQLGSFEILWRNVLPYTISKFCQVSGKCYNVPCNFGKARFFRSADELKQV